MRTGDLLGGRYRLIDRIASGGMGTVWNAEDDTLGRPVAIKVLHAALSTDESFQRRFRTEARVVSRLSAPGIVEVHDFGTDERHDDGPVVYLVMELVPGESLATVLRRRQQLRPSETMRLMAGCADALAVAHQRGVIHRDVKPGNILITPDSEPKIVDFGIARTAGDERITATGVVMGTAEYVAPEQLSGGDALPAGDIYSLGVVAYQCLAGKRPFTNDLPAAVINGALNKEPPPLPDGIPEAVSDVVMRALRKRPEDRPDAADFAAACREAAPAAESRAMIQRAPTPAPDPEEPRADEDEAASVPPTVDRPRRRHMLWASVAATVAMLLGIVLGVLVFSSSDNGSADPGRQSTTSSEATASSSDSPSSTTETESTTEQDEETDPGEDSPDEDPDAPEDDSSPQSPPDKTRTMPDVMGMKAIDARAELTKAGFTNVGESESPEGCWVDTQHPRPGSQHEPSTYVELRMKAESDDWPCD